MKAMIFAAGMGTRLKPLTDTMPKALVPVCDRPLLDHVLERLVAAGVEEFVVNVHHFADQIIEHVASLNSQGMHIAISDEREALLETGGAVLHARNLLEDATAAAFLVHNVDIVSDLDLRSFIGQHNPDDLATILVSERKTQRYFLFDKEMRLVGWTNVATGEVRSPFPDLDPASCRKFAFAGIHIMSNEIFDVMEQLGFSGRFSIVDFYLAACAGHRIRGLCPESLTLVDAGKLDSLAAAEDLIRKIY